MKKALLVTASVFLAVGIMFYVLIANSNRPNHIHFSTRGGVLKNVVYYSANPPETPAQHDCDGQFTEMRDSDCGRRSTESKREGGLSLGQSPFSLTPVRLTVFRTPASTCRAR